MRLNKYIALATGMSRRSADQAIKSGRVEVNGRAAALGLDVDNDNKVRLDGKLLKLTKSYMTLMLNKPEGYVTSRSGQGSKTIYDLLPEKYHHLKPVGRLDKDSSGLLLLTDDGELANKLTHPRYQKEKIYLVTLNKTLSPHDKQKFLTGIKLSDGMSKFVNLKHYSDTTYEIIITEGRNRQIRRTFNALGYKVERLHRIQINDYQLKKISKGKFTII